MKEEIGRVFESVIVINFFKKNYLKIYQNNILF
jgi:hypothetical protein